jgi:hypothetical protein
MKSITGAEFSFSKERRFITAVASKRGDFKSPLLG